MCLLLVARRQGNRKCACYLLHVGRGTGSVLATCCKWAGEQEVCLLLVARRQGNRKCACYLLQVDRRTGSVCYMLQVGRRTGSVLATCCK